MFSGDAVKGRGCWKDELMIVWGSVGSLGPVLDTLSLKSLRSSQGGCTVEN